MTSLPIQSAATEHSNCFAFDDGTVRLTYGEMETLLAKTAVPLDSLPHGSHVAWCPKNDRDAFLTFWAILYRGCVACPISHRFPDQKRGEILQRMDAKWLPELPTVESEASARQRDGGSDCPATMILSSGSAGVPKTIVHSMAAHVASAIGAAENIPLAPRDRWLWSLPLCHVSGLSILVRCAVSGATVVGMADETKLTASFVAETRASHLSVVSTQLRRLLADDQFPSPHLKAVLLGGSRVDSELVMQARERDVPVHTTYGLTEMASQVTTSTADGNPVKSGQVLPGRQLKISSSSEIIVRGKMLCRGYYRDGKIDSIVDEDGWFHTKDIGDLDDEGQLSVVGRIDNMFISGGENIHPESIEKAIASAFSIEQVVVVPIPDKVFGNRPVAFVSGTLPLDWPERLRRTMQTFEIPAEVFPWPLEAEGDVKPNRKMLQALASKTSQAKS